MEATSSAENATRSVLRAYYSNNLMGDKKYSQDTANDQGAKNSEITAFADAVGRFLGIAIASNNRDVGIQYLREKNKLCSVITDYVVERENISENEHVDGSASSLELRSDMAGHFSKNYVSFINSKLLPFMEAPLLRYREQMLDDAVMREELDKAKAEFTAGCKKIYKEYYDGIFNNSIFVYNEVVDVNSNDNDSIRSKYPGAHALFTAVSSFFNKIGISEDIQDIHIRECIKEIANFVERSNGEYVLKEDIAQYLEKNYVSFINSKLLPFMEAPLLRYREQMLDDAVMREELDKAKAEFTAGCKKIYKEYYDGIFNNSIFVYNEVVDVNSNDNDSIRSKYPGAHALFTAVSSFFNKIGISEDIQDIHIRECIKEIANFVERSNGEYVLKEDIAQYLEKNYVELINNKLLPFIKGTIHGGLEDEFRDHYDSCKEARESSRSGYEQHSDDKSQSAAEKVNKPTGATEGVSLDPLSPEEAQKSGQSTESDRAVWQ